MYSIIFMCCMFLVVQCKLQCRNEDGDSVDWFIAYKLPKIKDDKNSLVDNGLAYVYLTDKQPNKWILSEKSINSSKSLQGRTLSVLYDDKDPKEEGVSWLMYNDEPTNDNTSFTSGHTKGVIVTDKDGGFWLVHSVPKFPPVPRQHDDQMYMYPHSGMRFGQTFLCITLNEDEMNSVGIQLKYNEPYIYSTYISDKVGKKMPNLEEASRNMSVKSGPWFNQVDLKSSGGEKFLSFAKGKKFEKDLYADLVANKLEVNLFVETWRNGVGKLPSECNSSFKVYNIESLKLPSSPSQISFHSSKDHSKWSVSTVIDKPWVCIGDINRMKTQEIRGGGTVCLKKTKVWSLFNETIESIEPCSTVRVSTHSNSADICMVYINVLFVSFLSYLVK